MGNSRERVSGDAPQKFCSPPTRRSIRARTFERLSRHSRRAQQNQSRRRAGIKVRCRIGENDQRISRRLGTVDTIKKCRCVSIATAKIFSLLYSRPISIISSEKHSGSTRQRKIKIRHEVHNITSSKILTRNYRSAAKVIKPVITKPATNHGIALTSFAIKYQTSRGGAYRFSRESNFVVENFSCIASAAVI